MRLLGFEKDRKTFALGAGVVFVFLMGARSSVAWADPTDLAVPSWEEHRKSKSIRHSSTYEQEAMAVFKSKWNENKDNHVDSKKPEDLRNYIKVLDENIRVMVSARRPTKEGGV